MDEQAAMDAYNAAAARLGASGKWPPVRWPDLPLTAPVMVRLAGHLLEACVSFPLVAWGEDFDVEACADRLGEAWRGEGLQMRFAPEGVWVRAAFAVRVELAASREEADDAVTEELAAGIEFCLSFTNRHHTRPFVDVMGGEVVRTGDGHRRRIDPWAREIAPAEALAWIEADEPAAGGAA